MIELTYKKFSVSMEGDYYQIHFENGTDSDDKPYFLVQRTFEFPDKECYIESDDIILTGHYIVNSVMIGSDSFEIRYGCNDRFIVLIKCQLREIELARLVKASRAMFRNVSFKNEEKNIMRILLSDIVEAMDMQNDEMSAYLNIKTGEIISLYHEDSMLIDDEIIEEDKELRESVLESEDYIQIPDKFDINEYRIMEHFSLSIPGDIGGILYDNLSGSGAFRRFKDNINRFGIEDKWYKYLDNSYYDHAKGWCEVNEIHFIDDREKE